MASEFHGRLRVAGSRPGRGVAEQAVEAFVAAGGLTDEDPGEAIELEAARRTPAEGEQKGTSPAALRAPVDLQAPRGRPQPALEAASGAPLHLAVVTREVPADRLRKAARDAAR